MNPERLNILCVSQMPASPPRFGAQARMHGLMTELARRHDLTAVMLVDDEFDIEECRRAMQAYCREVVLIPNPYGRNGLAKRLLQLRSLASIRSFERLRVTVPAMQQALDRVLRARRFDIVNLEFAFLGHCDLRQAPPGEKLPRLVVDSHEIAYDLARQFARAGGSPAAGSTPKPIGESCSGRSLRPTAPPTASTFAARRTSSVCSTRSPEPDTAVIPNAADVDYFQPRPADPSPDGRTVVYFGLLSTVPNIDGVIHFVQDIWPRIAAAHPQARFKIIGGRPPPSLLALAGPRVELTGFVADLRPHLAAAAAVVVPLRLGGGTRLKIVEAMAMGKAIVSTTLGAEGIEAVPGRDLLIEDEPAAFADAVNRLAGRARPGGTHRPVGKATGGRTLRLERGGPGAGRLLPPHPGDRFVKAALIGAGQIARQHLACLKALPGVDLVAICDLSPATAEAAAERYGIRAWFTDHRAMLEKARPDVVHVTTPPTSHFAAGHGLVRRRRPRHRGEAGDRRPLRNWRRWSAAPEQVGRHLIEDYNYVFNHAPQEILRRIASGEFGAVTHVEVLICLDILGPSGFADPNSPHPALDLAGGAIADFLPHLASLAHCFVGPHRTAQMVWTKRKASLLPFDEFRAVVEAERGTAALGFSASSQPDAFWLRVYGERMQATANLFETRLTFDGPRNVPKPLRPFFSGLEEGKAIRRAAFGYAVAEVQRPRCL